jgi:hypothetical protein
METLFNFLDHQTGSRLFGYGFLFIFFCLCVMWIFEAIFSKKSCNNGINEHKSVESDSVESQK